MSQATLPSRAVHRQGLRPELRVLMETVRRGEDGLARQLDRDICWELLLLLAEEEKATPVLHRRLAEAVRAHATPPGAGEALEVLERLACVHRFRLLELERRLLALVGAYRSAGIHAVLLKGAALRMCVYGSLVERPMGDIDLLVEPAQVPAARAVALGLGWNSAGGGQAQDRYRGHHHAPPLEDDCGLGLELELHTELFRPGNPFALSGASVFRGARESEDESRALIPSPEHLLLHIALHFTWSHRLRFGAWRTFRDVDALLSRGGVDWDRFVQMALASRAGTGAFWTLHLARAWGGVPVENRVLAALPGPRPGPLRRRLERHFAFQILPPPGSAAPGPLCRWAWELAMRPGRQGHGGARPWSRLPGSVVEMRREPPDHQPDPADEAWGVPTRPSLALKGIRAMRHLAYLIP